MSAVLPLRQERDRFIKGKKDRPTNDGAYDDAPEYTVDIDDNGDAVVKEPEKAEAAETQHFENLAEVVDDIELNTIVTDLLEKIDYDKEARLRRQEQYAEGLRRTGLGGEAPGGATFAGASKAVHPMLAEAAVDFAASAMKELFPSDGPVKTKIEGVQDQDKLEVADRQGKCLNWQLTEQIPEYADELEQTLTQLPMGGSQYMKFYKDDDLRRATCEFVPIDDLLIPYSCKDFWSAARITHVQRLSESEWNDRVESGMYADVDSGEGESEDPDQTKPAAANERIEGTSAPTVNIDGIRIVYEISVNLKLTVDDEKRLPYLISVCEKTRKVCALYRNWDEDDKRQQRLHWIVDYGFIPWRGAYKIGLPHLIGGLSAAATGALRALLDSALIATMPVLAKMKSSKFAGQTKEFDPNTAIEIDASTGLDDIRKAMMPLPFPGPSPVLFQLLGWLTDAAKGVVTTAEEKISEASNQMPVGTALALIEQGAKVYSSIHSRLHRSQKRALQIVARINATDEDLVASQRDALGEILATPEDFKRPLGVIPVSDPNIFSEGQRYAQMHLVQSFATNQLWSQMHNQYEVVRSAYQLAKIPNIDKILPPPKEPIETNAAAENSAVMLGRPLTAFPDQDHAAHIETHMRFITDPLMGGNPAAVPVAWPAMIEHLKQHLSFMYAKTMFDMVSASMGQDVGELLKDKKNGPKIDQLLAAASLPVHNEIKRRLGDLQPQMQAMLQHVMQIKQPPPMDPSQAAIQVANLEDKRLREETEADNALREKELAEKAAKDAADAINKAEANRVAEEAATKQHALDSEAALQAAARISGDQQQQDFDQQQATLQGGHARSMEQMDQEHQHGMDMLKHNQAQQGIDNQQENAQADRDLQAQQQPPGASDEE